MGALARWHSLGQHSVRGVDNGEDTLAGRDVEFACSAVVEDHVRAPADLAGEAPFAAIECEGNQRSR